MKTTFLLIRHGQSLANIAGTFAGHSNYPLSPLGEKQAVETAAYIRDKYTPDIVYASDLDRAFFTGKAVADTLGIPIFAEEGLREIFAGDWEGLSFTQLSCRFAEAYQIWRQNIGHAVCTNGESVAELQKRILAACTRIAEAHSGKTIVAATHATPIRVLQCHCMGKTLDEMHNIRWVSNGSISVMEMENGRFTMPVVGYDEHLGDLCSSLPANV